MIGRFRALCLAQPNRQHDFASHCVFPQRLEEETMAAMHSMALR